MSDEPPGPGRDRARINPPGRTCPTDPDYARQCRFSLRPSLEGLIDLAVEAGWRRRDVVAAVLCTALEACGVRIDERDIGDLVDALVASGAESSH